MYVDKEYADKLNVVVPQEVILEANCQMLLPVYLALYIMADTNMNPLYKRTITLMQLCEATRVFNTQIRTANCNVVTSAMQWLIDKGCITVAGKFVKATDRFSYDFTDSPSGVAKEDKIRFALLTMGELDTLLNRLKQVNKQWKHITGVLRAYIYFRLRQYAWQYKKAKRKIPAWSGYFNVAAGELGISRQALTNYIKDLQAVDVIQPIYGSYRSTGAYLPQTIVVFTLLCGKDKVMNTMWSCEAILKTDYPNAVWYPPIKVGGKSIAQETQPVDADESALDIECAE